MLQIYGCESSWLQNRAITLIINTFFLTELWRAWPIRVKVLDYLKKKFFFFVCFRCSQDERIRRRKRKDRSTNPRSRQKEQPLGGKRKVRDNVNDFSRAPFAAGAFSLRGQTHTFSLHFRTQWFIFYSTIKIKIIYCDIFNIVRILSYCFISNYLRRIKYVCNENEKKNYNIKSILRVIV